MRVESLVDLPVSEYQLERNGRLVSVSRRVEEIAPLQFLGAAQGRERFLWRDGRSAVTLAGCGIAANIMAWGEARFKGIERQVRALFSHAASLGDEQPLAAPRIFGGFAFRQDFAPDNAWAGYHPAQFILPHYQLAMAQGEAWLTINALIAAGDDPAESHGQLLDALETFVEFVERRPDAPVQRQAESDAELRYPMSFDSWSDLIAQAIHRFETSDLNKVVLARVCEHRQTTPVDVDGAVAALIEKYDDCYVFLFEPQPGHAFFGATPELLVSVQGRKLQSMSLAGSIQRGHTPDEDAALSQQLLDSAKDRHEHQLVVDAVRRRLEPLTTSLEIGATPQILRLSNIQHLYTPTIAQLTQAQGVLPLVEALHPTPALGGSPRDLAMDFISEAEPVPRGWYAAPIGWIDHNLDGAFGVAIRSAVAQDRRVWLYAGAGIVAESKADKEWEETGWKFRPIQEALGV